MDQNLRGLKFFVRTFGCQMNENDSEHIAGILAGAGAEPVETPGGADILVVNTCAVREKSEEKLYSFLGRLAPLKKKRGTLIGVAGCVAQIYKEDLFRRRPFIDFVVGPDHYPDLPSILLEAAEGPRLETGWGREWRETGHAQTLRQSATSALVTIMEGCDNFCSYCVVPFARGREKYRPRENVLREVQDLAASGAKEILLLGQNVNSYRDPGSGRGFSALVEEAAAVEGIAWLRFITSHPKDFGDDIIEAMAANPKICRQIHLPLQSGSTAVLTRMNRGYSREDYLALVGRLRQSLPGLPLSTDIIVGYPGETEDDFEDTCRALADVRFANIFSFRYSPRPLTAACRVPDDVPFAVKRRRLVALQELQKSIQLEMNRSFLGTEVRVLCTGPSARGAGRFAGRTEGYQVVNFDAPPDPDPTGQFVRVRVTGCGPYSLHGELTGRGTS